MDKNISFANERGCDDRVPLLELRSVTKCYGSKRVLDELSFSFDRGRIVGLLGPNGAGKTTIIKLINKLIEPSSGELLFDGQPLGHQSHSHIAYLPERDPLPSGDRVCDIIDFFADMYRDFDRVKANELADRLGIDKGSRIRTLSKGERERVQLILVMSRNALLYVLDEPIGGVDPAARERILEMIRSNYSGDGSILISTHLIADIEPILDDAIFLSNGKAALCASVELIHEKHGMTVDELFRELYRSDRD